MKKLLIFIIILIFPLFLSGCFLQKSPNELLSKPTTYIYGKDSEKIINFLNKDGKSLTLALGDEDKSSIREVDLDNDGNYEILILYKKETAQFNYGILVLKENNKDYEILNNITFAAKSIDKVVMKDLTGDRKPEIVIGVKTPDGNNNILYVYSYERGFFECIFDSNYINFHVDRLWQNGQNLLTLVNDKKTDPFKFTEDTLKSLEVYKFSGIKNNLLDSVTFKKPVKDICIKIGKASEYDIGIFATLNIDNSFIYTDIFILKSRKLIDVFENESKNKSLNDIKNVTFYQPMDSSNNPYATLDSFVSYVNNDDIYDIKVTKSNFIERKIQISFDVNYWYNWNNRDGENSTTLIFKNFINEKYNYSINLPLSLENNVIVLKDLKDEKALNRTDFFINDCESDNNLLFSVKVYDNKYWEENQFNDNNNENSIVVSSSLNRVYVIFPNSALCDKYTNLSDWHIKNDLFKYLP